MIPDWINKRVDTAVLNTPAMMRWIEHCDATVVDAYRSARRSLLTRQLPLLVVVALVANLVKALHWFVPSHPVRLTLMLLAMVVVAWPPPMVRVGRAAWRCAPSEPRYGTRLRVMAVTLVTAALIATVGLLGMAVIIVEDLVK